jgi:hypothetical protein
VIGQILTLTTVDRNVSDLQLISKTEGNKISSVYYKARKNIFPVRIIETFIHLQYII